MSQLPKPIRVVDKELIEEVKLLPCMGCGVEPCGEADHVTTRGAGGGDTADNLIPLCRTCHTTRHAVGWGKFIEGHPVVRNWMRAAKREDILDVWRKYRKS